MEEQMYPELLKWFLNLHLHDNDGNYSDNIIGDVAH